MEAIVPCEDLKCVLVLIGEDKVHERLMLAKMMALLEEVESLHELCTQQQPAPDCYSDKVLLEQQLHSLQSRVDSLQPLQLELHQVKARLASIESYLEELQAAECPHDTQNPCPHSVLHSTYSGVNLNISTSSQRQVDQQFPQPLPQPQFQQTQPQQQFPQSQQQFPQPQPQQQFPQQQPQPQFPQQQPQPQFPQPQQQFPQSQQQFPQPQPQQQFPQQQPQPPFPQQQPQPQFPQQQPQPQFPQPQPQQQFPQPQSQQQFPQPQLQQQFPQLSEDTPPVRENKVYRVRKDPNGPIQKLQNRLQIVTEERDNYKQISERSQCVENAKIMLEKISDVMAIYGQEAHTKLDSVVAESSKLREEAEALKIENDKLISERDALLAKLEHVQSQAEATVQDGSGSCARPKKAQQLKKQ